MGCKNVNFWGPLSHFGVNSVNLGFFYGCFRFPLVFLGHLCPCHKSKVFAQIRPILAHFGSIYVVLLNAVSDSKQDIFRGHFWLILGPFPPFSLPSSCLIRAHVTKVMFLPKSPQF